MPCTKAQHDYNKHIVQPTEPNCLLKEKTHVPINPRPMFTNSTQDGSAMNKSTRIVLLCTVCVAAALASSFLTTDILVRHQVAGVPDSHSQDLPNLEGVTKNNGYYNITLAFINVTDSENLDNILVNPQSSKTVIDSTFYLNGTAINPQDPVSCNLNSGDSLQINLTLPCTEFPSGSTITLQVMGNSFGSGKAVVLP